MKVLLLKKILAMSRYVFFGLVLQLATFSILVAAIPTNAQRKSMNDIFMNINVQNAFLVDVFKEIEQASGLRFAYNHENLNNHDRINLQAENESLAKILESISQQSKLKFKRINENIHVSKLSESDKEAIEEILSAAQTRSVTGTVVSREDGETLPGVNVIEKGTNNGTITDFEGQYTLEVSDGAVLVFSSVGYMSTEVAVGNRSEINIQMAQDVRELSEIVVVGYGVQRRSDLTGSVTSVPQDRLDQRNPNLNISQAIQGAVPGVVVQSSAGGARPSQTILIRGRNSITADNTPLIIVDGISYGGNLTDLNPNDVESIEILKDASAAAIYGSRGANGVILVTTRGGVKGDTRINYDVKYSTQGSTMFPEVMDGEQFYHFKQQREPGSITASEQAVYDSGNWTDWPSLGLRRGQSHQHNLSLSGGMGTTNFFISANYLDVDGIALNDQYERIIGRINVETELGNWLTIGTRSSFANSDQSGEPVSTSGSNSIIRFNPLSTAFNSDGTPTQFPWPEETTYGNPLAPTLVRNIDQSNQVISNNFALINFPFIEGLTNRINFGIDKSFLEYKRYRPSTTVFGSGQHQGDARLQADRRSSTVLENILSYIRDFDRHSVHATGVLSYERNSFSRERMDAEVFPNDILGWHAIGQANALYASTDFRETTLLSQMARLNYVYDSRYLITLTARRDGYSGFGDNTKWGFFPSVSLAWRVANEDFFPWPDFFTEFKPRLSFGWNGNQAVSPYQTMARVSAENTVSRGQTQAGFVPTSLANELLGWESSRVLNVGLDFEILQARFYGSIEMYNTNTFDLLLARSISTIHGITTITQNIGETKNRGLEFSFRSRNIVSPNFQWASTGNMSFNSNEIVDLYGDGTDDVGNRWFIGQPIRVNYDYVMDGVWQLDEAEAAEAWGSQPGFVKLKDVDGDGRITGDDRQIIGRQDPNFLWGLNNSFSLGNFRLDLFIHGVHGVTRNNELLQDAVARDVRRNTVVKNWWTPDNPTNEFWMNHFYAGEMDGVSASIYQDASFIRIKDISLSYALPANLIQSIGFQNVGLSVTGRNLVTFSNWTGIDPELPRGYDIPLQREYVFGLNLGF